ncbi:MAG: hypothetical protein Kow0042_28820 [Calditrichia bacterium]
MARIFIKSVRILFILLVIIYLILAIWYAWEHFRDPIQILKGEFTSLELIDRQEYPVQLEAEIRIYQDLTLLSARKKDTLKITVSLPHPLPSAKLPVVFLLGGLEIGRESLRYIPFHGQNIIVAYQYPYSPRYWYDEISWKQIPAIRRAVLMVPGQVISLIQWLRNQPDYFQRRVSVIGYSFGAMFIPAIYHLGQELEVPLGPGVIAYGGANINLLLKTNLRFMKKIPRFLVANLASTAIHAVEPALHLPQLRGNFLVINGKQDHQIPRESWEQLHSLLPEPKTIVLLDEGHMHPRKTDLTLRIVQISRKWLLENGAIGP